MINYSEKIEGFNPIRELNPKGHLKYGQYLRSSSGLYFNVDQREFIHRGLRGDSFLLIGGGGTGKTEVASELINMLCTHKKISIKHKTLPSIISPVLVVSFTNKSTDNIRSKIKRKNKNQVLTIHKALEYVYHPVTECDNEGHLISKKISFPARYKDNKLEGINYCIIEESTLVEIYLYKELVEALPDHCSIIMMGDINQQEPVFGSSALSYKLTNTDHVELRHTYRQSLKNPATYFLEDLKRGKITDQITDEQLKAKYNNTNKFGNFQIKIMGTDKKGSDEISNWWKILQSNSFSNPMIGNLSIEESPFLYHIEKNWKHFNNNNQIWLCPQNIGLGNFLIGSSINAIRSIKAGIKTHQIIAGTSKLYFAEGDLIQFKSKEYIIESIEPNEMYSGIIPETPRVEILRDGSNATPADIVSSSILNAISNEIRNDCANDVNIENLASRFNTNFKSVTSVMINYNDAIHQASSVIIARRIDGDCNTRIFSKTSEVSALIPSNSLSFFKAQGLQWRYVDIYIHKSHHRQVRREQLYTAVSRTTHSVVLWVESGAIQSMAMKQSTKGNSLKEKIAYLVENGVNDKRLTSRKAHSSLIE